MKLITIHHLLPMHVLLLVVSIWPTTLFSLVETASFGKTHFILGHTKPKLIVKNQEPVAHTLLAPDGVIKHAFFSPDHNVRDIFIDLIAHEQESIKIAIYFFTDKPVAQALLAAIERGITVEVITDKSCIRSKYNKLDMLSDRSVPVYIFDGNNNLKSGSYSSLMHNKFALFKKNIGHKSILWTGSFNFTRTATLHNQENVVVLDDRVLFEKFDQQFAVVKSRCKQYSTSVMVAQATKKKRPQKMKKMKLEYMGDLPALTV